MYRIGIVGASTLLGKELAEALSESALAASTVVLLDSDELAGVVTAAGDEASVVQKLDAESFEGMDFAFFAADAALTRTHWQVARAAGASVIDLTFALEGQSGAVVLAPWVAEMPGVTQGKAADLQTTAVIVAHPAAAMLALVAGRLGGLAPLTSVSATVLEPASDRGQAAMDELQQQTISLLSFKSLPREQHDVQVAFNLLPRLGQEAKVAWAATQQRIVTHAGLVAPGLAEFAVQLVHAPVFHGYTISVLVAFERPLSVLQVERALVGAHVDLVSEASDPPSNLSAAGQNEVLTQVQAGFAEESGRRFWLWLAADNLRLTALAAVGCALELRRLRPRGKVQ